MPKTHPVSFSSETHGLAGNLVLPDGAEPGTPVPGAVILGGPGPVPLTRYSTEGAKQWPVRWSEALGQDGLAALCFDQRGSGLSSGLYHEADWDGLFEDARAAADMLSVQPEVSRVAAIAWAEGCAFALQLALEGRVDALVLMAPAYHTAEARYQAELAALAARKGLSDRVVQIRVSQWRQNLNEMARRVAEGEMVSTVELSGKRITMSLARLLQTMTFDPAAVVGHIRLPALLLHGEADAAIPPAESAAMAGALTGQVERITYPGVAHFLYRHPGAVADAAAWLMRTLRK